MLLSHLFLICLGWSSCGCSGKHTDCAATSKLSILDPLFKLKLLYAGGRCSSWCRPSSSRCCWRCIRWGGRGKQTTSHLTETKYTDRFLFVNIFLHVWSNIFFQNAKFSSLCTNVLQCTELFLLKVTQYNMICLAWTATMSLKLSWKKKATSWHCKNIIQAEKQYSHIHKRKHVICT